MKLSVIILTWNSSKYIGECLRSVLSQISDEIELIVVDDGSSDSTAKVVRQIGSSAIKLIRHEKNRGPVHARKTGISNAKGDYIAFLDSDDVVEPETYRKLLERLSETEPDMLVFGYDKVIDGLHSDGMFPVKVAQDRERRIKDSIALKSSPFVWHKIVSRSICEQIVFPPENMAEDWSLSVQYSILSDNVDCVEDVFYHYNMRSDSYSHNNASDERIIARAMSEKANIEFMESLLHGKERGATTYVKELDARKCNVKRMLFPVLWERKNIRIWRNVFSEVNFRIFFNGYLGLKYKFKHFFALIGIYAPLYSVYTNLTRR